MVRASALDRHMLSEHSKSAQRDYRWIIASNSNDQKIFTISYAISDCEIGTRSVEACIDSGPALVEHKQSAFKVYGQTRRGPTWLSCSVTTATTISLIVNSDCIYLYWGIDNFGTTLLWFEWSRVSVRLKVCSVWKLTSLELERSADHSTVDTRLTLDIEHVFRDCQRFPNTEDSLHRFLWIYCIELSLIVVRVNICLIWANFFAAIHQLCHTFYLYLDISQSLRPLIAFKQSFCV